MLTSNLHLGIVRLSAANVVASPWVPPGDQNYSRCHMQSKLLSAMVVLSAAALAHAQGYPTNSYAGYPQSYAPGYQAYPGAYGYTSYGQAQKPTGFGTYAQGYANY